MATRERAIPFGIKGPELNFQVVGGLPVYPDGVVPVEETIATGLTASVYNYIEYWLAGWGWLYGSTSAMDLSNCDSVHITGSTVVGMAWPHAYGMKSNSRVDLLLSDNTAIELASGHGELSSSWSTYIYNVDATIDLSGYSAEQLSSASVRVGLGDISAGGGATSGLRHDANLTIDSVTGTSVSAKPGPPVENPIENTIWVNTDEETTGWSFDTSLPRDISWFEMTDAGTVCILSGRTYTKVNAGLAIVGIYVNNGQYTGPLIVSETADAVTYSATSGGPWSYSTTITHGGKTWYVNNTEHFYGGGPEDTSGLNRYKCSATTPAAAAEELLNAYESVKAKGSIDIEHGYIHISTGPSSFVPFNALKENYMLTQPIATSQWDGSKWVFRDGHIYQNGEWITFFAPKNEGCWTFKKYASGASTPHPSDFVGKTVTETKIFKDSDLSTSMAIGDSYSAMCTTYLYFDADTTMSISFTTDDNGSVTLNGTLLGDLTSCTAKSISCPFKALKKSPGPLPVFA